MVRRLVLYTVGGSEDPIFFSIQQNRPERSLFIVSAQTRATLDSLLSALEAAGIGLAPGAVKIAEVADAEDFGECVRVIAQLDREIYDWQSRGPGYEVVADLTGGTKCMSAALALIAQRWPCMFSYVAGTQRNKGGVGVVKTGSERLLLRVNPWTALGYQALEDALVLLGRHDYAGAQDALGHRIVTMANNGSAAAGTKRALATLQALCEFLALWDVFDHAKAVHALDQKVFKNFNDLAALFPGREGELRLRLAGLQVRLTEVLAAPRGVPIVRDLLSNARRCAERGRFDDGVARLYRVLEAAAQIRLREIHGEAETSSFPADRLPGELSQRWAARVDEGRIRLGLQDVYELLAESNDALAVRFRRANLHDPHGSPLIARNHSILAHGFGAVGRKAFEQLWPACMEVLSVKDSDLTEFPGPWLALVGGSPFESAGIPGSDAVSQSSPG